MYIGMSLANS